MFAGFFSAIERIHEKKVWFITILLRKFREKEKNECAQCLRGDIRQTSMKLKHKQHILQNWFSTLWQVVFLNGHRPTNQLTNQWFMIVWHENCDLCRQAASQSKIFCETMLFFKVVLCFTRALVVSYSSFFSHRYMMLVNHTCPLVHSPTLHFARRIHRRI